VPLAGNSIGTDRRFLATQLPALEDFLHYRSVDVSTVKELARRWRPDVYKAAPAKKGGHRALADIRESVCELAYYRASLFDLGPGGGAAAGAGADTAGTKEHP
jgi:oligoribonuclease